MRLKEGIVISSKMKDTISVRVDTMRAHPKYKKLVRTSKKFYAHDPGNTRKEGETVVIYETRPLSKLKRWTVIKPVINSL